MEQSELVQFDADPEELQSQLFLSQDPQFMISKSFLKKADPSLQYNDPKKYFLLSFFLPLIGSFLWLCIPLVGNQVTRFFLFAFIFQPIVAIFHCVLLWTLLSLYLPTPPPRVKFFSVLLSLLVNLVVLLNVIWLEPLFLHGTRFILILALFSICVPIFVFTFLHCKKIILLGRSGKTEVIGVQAIDKATNDLAGVYQPMINKQGTEYNFFKYICSNVPSNSILCPWKPASLKKRSWSMFVGIIFDIAIYSFLIIFSYLIFNNTQEPVFQVLSALALYFVEIITHKISSLVSIKLDKELCFEIPQYLFHSFFIDLIFYSYNRNALFLSVTSYGAFALWQLVHIVDDTYAGLFTYYSYKWSHVPLLGKISIPNIPEVKEVVAMQYFGKKQAQIFSNVAFILFMFLLKYYWNKDLFPYDEEQHMELLVVYSISMFLVDFATGCISFFVIHKNMQPTKRSYFQLIQDFYSYPRVGIIVALLSLLSLMYTYTAIFFTQKL